MRCKSFLMVMVAAVVVGLAPVSAEDLIGTRSDVTELGPYRYKVYQYPSHVTSFFFYPQSYVTFDAVNGKYWSVESHRFRYEMIPRLGSYDVFPTLSTGYRPLRPEQLAVHFYTPDMKLLGSFPEVYANRRYSIPRDGNDYERIVVRMESDSEMNWDLKMRIWDPVDPVMAEPQPRQVYKR